MIEIEKLQNITTFQGKGASASVKYTETKQDIYIGRGECLTTGDAAHKLRMISRLFNDDVEEED